METKKVFYEAPEVEEVDIRLEINILSGTGDDWTPGGED